MRDIATQYTRLAIITGIALRFCFSYDSSAHPQSKSILNLQTARVAEFADQASKGHDIYQQQCTGCHQDDLSGSDMVPPLAGSGFMARWVGKTAKDLYDRARTTMPSNDPGSLMPQEYLNLTAYILQVNGIAPPPELSADTLDKVAIH